jgi:hypothetical protein
MAPIFQPISGIMSDPVERAGLGLEAGNVFLLPIWIGAYDMPLNPKLAGLWSEPEFARWAWPFSQYAPVSTRWPSPA